METPGHILHQAARVAAGATRTRYDGVSIALHWTTALLVLLLFALGETWGYAPRPLRHELVVLHMSLGILLGLAVAVRIGWRFVPGHAVAPAGHGRLDRAGRAMHWLLYILLVGQALFGWIVRWSEGRDMSFFGLLIPSPLSPVGPATHHELQDLHGKLGWAIVILAALHAAAALYHHFALRDGVLRRMLPARGGRPGAA
jgi:cytochrome b561